MVCLKAVLGDFNSTSAYLDIPDMMHHRDTWDTLLDELSCHLRLIPIHILHSTHFVHKYRGVQQKEASLQDERWE
jgi:hypothetical protein